MWGGSGRGGASNLTGADRGRMWIGAVSPASRHLAAAKLLLLDTCVSYQADTSRIVHQSHTATCLAILIHKSEIKVRSI